jgi:hypothetical protein
VGIRGNRHYVVVPPSVDASGVLYTWVRHPGLPSGPPPVVSLDELGWLGVTLALENTKEWEARGLEGLPTWTVVVSRPTATS